MRAVLARALTGVLDERGVECAYIVIADVSGDLRVEQDLASRRQEREAALHLAFQIPTAKSGRGAESFVETELPALVPHKNQRGEHGLVLRQTQAAVQLLHEDRGALSVEEVDDEKNADFPRTAAR
jgi:hypothetical protein